MDKKPTLLTGGLSFNCCRITFAPGKSAVSRRRLPETKKILLFLKCCDVLIQYKIQTFQTFCDILIQ